MTMGIKRRLMEKIPVRWVAVSLIDFFKILDPCAGLPCDDGHQSAPHGEGSGALAPWQQSSSTVLQQHLSSLGADCHLPIVPARLQVVLLHE